MRRRGRVPPVAAGISALLMIAVHGASLDDGKTVFARREDTMKHMGRPLFLGIGRVVKGAAAYGPDTVTAAETVASLAGTLDRSLFLPGSDVAESKIKPAIFNAGDHVDQLIAAVQTPTLQPAAPRQSRKGERMQTPCSQENFQTAKLRRARPGLCPRQGRAQNVPDYYAFTMDYAASATGQLPRRGALATADWRGSGRAFGLRHACGRGSLRGSSDDCGLAVVG
jgi:cytochrome c556